MRAKLSQNKKTMTKNHSRDPAVIEIATEIAHALDIQQPSPFEKIDHSVFSHENLWVKRDDLLHPIISGNKWRKLQISLARIIKSKQTHVLSFGGGYSNHLHALAYACHKLNITLTCIVRGNYEKSPTPTILDIRRWGGEIIYVTKSEYRQRNDAGYLKRIADHYAADVLLPEGGTCSDGIDGVATLIDECVLQGMPDVIILPVGSAGTLAGIIKGINEINANTKVIGVSVLNAGNSHYQTISELYPKAEILKNWGILTAYHHGGYAKQSQALIEFTDTVSNKLGFSLDPVYNAKSFYALDQQIKSGNLSDNDSICILQTGGNQGIRAKK